MHDETDLEPDHAARKRQGWRARREAMEAAPLGRRWRGQVRHHVHGTAAVASRLLGPTGIFRRGTAHALNLDLTELSFAFPDLPSAFDGYRILHLTDLHLDNIDETAAVTARRVAGVEADLCVITGDIRDNIHSYVEPVVHRLKDILSELRVTDGMLGVLGNHDSAAMVEPLEALGIRMLVNETMMLRRGANRIHVTGVDDVHLFHTWEAVQALSSAPDGLGIALVHSPELADRASARHRLYLCGHTHGGKMSLPNGRPIITGLKRHRRFAQGLWFHDEMIGYTSRGVGASLVPTRFRSQGEVAVVTLRRGPQSVSASSD
jgi:predicted MPP superfamily phosphohydrolase